MALRLNQPSEDKRDLERQKAEAIALCQRRIQAAVDLYGDGRISREEYHRRVELNERELLSWQARTTESEQLAVELSMCIQAVEAMKSLWDSCSDDDRQGMARHLFEYIVFDLDLQQIVDFRLKPWAEQFMQARVLLYLEEGYGENYERNPVTPTGLLPHKSLGMGRLIAAIRRFIRRLYPTLQPRLTKQQRDVLIRARHAVVEALSDLAREFGISPQRAWQIVEDVS